MPTAKEEALRDSLCRDDGGQVKGNSVGSRQGSYVSGGRQALGRLLAEDYSRNKWKLDEAIYNTFDAKAHAEIVQGVGIDWDGEVILGSMSKRIPIPIASAIGQWFDEITKSPFSREKAVHRRRLLRWRAQLSKFSKKALLESQS